jgi:hypothetical protein
MISGFQTGRTALGREGSLHFFRIERDGMPLEEKRLENTPLTFTLAPGNYELRAYSRACDGNCSRVGSPIAACTVPFSVTAGQALYAERIVQDVACTIRFNDPPQ